MKLNTEATSPSGDPSTKFDFRTSSPCAALRYFLNSGLSATRWSSLSSWVKVLSSRAGSLEIGSGLIEPSRLPRQPPQTRVLLVCGVDAELLAQRVAGAQDGVDTTRRTTRPGHRLDCPGIGIGPVDLAIRGQELVVFLPRLIERVDGIRGRLDDLGISRSESRRHRARIVRRHFGLLHPGLGHHLGELGRHPPWSARRAACGGRWSRLAAQRGSLGLRRRHGPPWASLGHQHALRPSRRIPQRRVVGDDRPARVGRRPDRQVAARAGPHLLWRRLLSLRAGRDEEATRSVRGSHRLDWLCALRREVDRRLLRVLAGLLRLELRRRLAGELLRLLRRLRGGRGRRRHLRRLE